MQAAIGYLRVSTREQGRSGLGLAAPRYDIEAFGVREGFRIKSWYQDIQTGAGKDALPADGLEARPPVAKRALHHRAHGAQGAFRCCGAGSRLRRVHASHLCLARRTRAEDDFGTRQGRTCAFQRQVLAAAPHETLKDILPAIASFGRCWETQSRLGAC
jgi:hypothetical protein